MIRSLALLIALALTTPGQASEEDAIFITGLRRLQLFDLAERYCRQELQEQDNTVDRQAELTIELMRTLALHAMSLPASEREVLWNAAREVAAEFQRSSSKHPQLLLVQVQDALTLLAEGEVLQMEAEATSAGPTAMQHAAEQLRLASKALEEVMRVIDREIPARRTQSLKEEELSAAELARLAQNVTLHLARARRLQALCYPADSRDRKAMLLATLEALNDAVKGLESSDELAGRMRLLQMVCLRELGQFSDAAEVWKLIETDDVPLDIRRAGLAEAARIFVAGGKPQQGLALLDDPKFAALATTRNIELDLARLEATLALARSEEAEPQRTKWQKMAAALAQRIDQEHGAIAGRRADQLVTALLPSDATASNVDLLARVADNLYLKKQIEEAIAAYDKAAAAAEASGDINRQYELRYKAALVEQQRKHYAAAATRLERLAIELKNHPQAAKAHLAACWNKAQQAKEDEPAISSYVEMLKEHVTRWPAESTSDQARLWLGQWHQSQQQWGDAFLAYSAIAPQAEHFPLALERAALCARKRLEADSDDEAAAETSLYFQSIARRKDVDPAVAQQAALTAADLLMQYVRDGHAAAEKLLREVQAAFPEGSDTWKNESTVLLVAAMAGQPSRAAEAQKHLESLAADSRQLLRLLERVAASSKQASAKTRADVAAIQLAILERLNKSDARFTTHEQADLVRLRADALIQLGRRDEALDIYASLAKEAPQNGDVQEAYASLLADSSEKKSLESALARWRQIAARSAPRSERWHRAKYAVAKLQCELGDKKNAATLCRFLLETPPGLQKPWRQQFSELLAECEK